MASNTRKRKRQSLSNSSEEDRISKLPDALLHHILSFLTTEEVVRTCVLSKRWRYMWASLPFLYFDSNTFNIIKSKEDIMDTFINFVNQVLLRHQCSHVVKFWLHLQFTVRSDVVESWICYALKHHVQDLWVDARDDGIDGPFVLPRCFCSCESLTRLKLSGRNDIIGKLESLGLSSLTILHLDECHSLKLDRNFFLSCPNLETLILESVYAANLNIHALNLKFFRFGVLEDMFDSYPSKVEIFAPKLTKFEFVGDDVTIVWLPDNLTCPDEVTIDFYLYGSWSFDVLDEDKQGFGLRLMNMLNKFSNAKSITLSLDAIKVLSLVPAALNEHRSAFPNLKCLRLKTDWWRNCRHNGFNVPACILTYFLNSSTLLKVCY